MLSSIRVLVLVFITSVLAACGGGGGADDSGVNGGVGGVTPSFEGLYWNSSTVISNTCGNNPSPVEGPDTVTQNGRNISIQSGELALTGTVDSDNGGFTLTGILLYGGKIAHSTVSYRTTATPSTYTKRHAIDVHDSLDVYLCTVVYEGTALKI